MFRQYEDLSEDERKEIAKQCEHSHPICVASLYRLDVSTVHLCAARYKTQDGKDKIGG